MEISNRTKHLLWFIGSAIAYLCISFVVFLCPISALIEIAYGNVGWAIFEVVSFYLILSLREDVYKFVERHWVCYKASKG